MEAGRLENRLEVLVIAAFTCVCHGACTGTSGSRTTDADVAADGSLSHDGGADGGLPNDAGSDGASGDAEVPDAAPKGPLAINELMAENQGVHLDEAGEADDWLELINVSDQPLALATFSIADKGGERVTLPMRELGPGEVLLLWADDDLEQGELHLPFKLSAGGDSLWVYQSDGQLSDSVSFTSAKENESLARLPDERGAFVACRYATPGRRNGTVCVPASPPSLDDVTFAPFTWPTPPLAVDGPLRITEAALFPASFVEVLNASNRPIDLNDFTLRLSPHGPGLPWPDAGQGRALSFPTGLLAAGERVVVTLQQDDVAAVAADPAREGVLTVFERTTQAKVSRLDFMRWPDGATLMRVPEDQSGFRFCTNTTRGDANQCAALASRDTGQRIRHLRTPSDFSMLSEGEHTVGIESAKFIVDLEAGDVVHLLGSLAWPLHYTFIREQIYGEPPLDRCDPTERAEFNAGWSAFSQTEYFQVEGRRFLLGTLSHHAGSDLRAVEYTFGDAISAAQMSHGFYAAVAHTEDPTRWSLRPQDQTQVDKARMIEGTLPIVGPNAPFAGIAFQGLTEGTGYGTLRFIPASELEHEALGPRVIVVTDDVPNDIPFVGGLVTEAFQTPLAHVNVLSQNRGTPNMALPGARDDARIKPFLDKLVRLSVNAGGFSIDAADPIEAQAFWDAQAPSGPVLTPRLDTTVRDLTPLEGSYGLEMLPAIGAKAAQMGELARVTVRRSDCPEALPIPHPDRPFAIPVVHYLEHAEASGAQALIQALIDSREADPAKRAEKLAAIRSAILTGPVSPSLLAAVDQAVADRWDSARVRFRSSSNTEDLPSFSGAGIYTSTSAERGDIERPIDTAMRTVWASLWNDRAYDEREFARIDHSEVAMGILVHPAYLSEEANGVAISRNVLDPTRGDQYYLNLQFGEASVTNPAPGISTEQLVYQLPPRTPAISYKSVSSLGEGHVLSDSEVVAVGCALWSIHRHYRGLLDPLSEQPWFAMQVELKLEDGSRALSIKQARPHSFGSVDLVGDCREF